MNRLTPSIPPPPYTASAADTLPTPDIETASIFSAAPSYTSRVPSPSISTNPAPLPAIPKSRNPSLADYYTTGWTRAATPASRHYNSIAARRAEAAAARDSADVMRAAKVTRDPVAAARKVVAEREREEFGSGEGGGKRVRPLEDPELVGEEAAEEARAARMRREGHEVLVREDKRWDWLLAQMEDWERREESWKRFRKEKERTKTEKLRALGFGKSFFGPR